MHHSSESSKARKPTGKADSEKFPLYLHKTGQFAKKVRGRVFYFGRDRSEALAKWQEQEDDLRAGRMVRPKSEAATATVSHACNLLLTQKRALVDSGEFSMRTWRDYQSAGKRLTEHFGRNRLLTDLRAQDFAEFRAVCAKGRGAVSLANTLRYVRAILKFSYDAELVDQPIRYGKALALPSQAVLRAVRHEQGPRMFTADEIRTLLDGKTVQQDGSDPEDISGALPTLKAMILMAINCGFGQSDCSNLPLRDIELDRGWHNFPRPKTKEPRRCALWPETVAAIREYLKVRPAPKEAHLKDRVFLTRFGDEFVKVRVNVKDEKTTVVPIDAVGLIFGKLLTKMEMKRPGVAFYSLRRTFRTVADEVNDQPAIALIMGHSAKADDMAARYRQTISDERLKAVSDYVRAWLFGKTERR